MPKQTDPHIIGKHEDAIAAKRRKLAKKRAELAQAEDEFNTVIRAAFADGVIARRIAGAAGIGIDRAYQIKHRRR